MALAGSFLDRTEFATRTIAPASYVHGDFIDPTGQFSDPAKVARRTAHQAFVEAQLVITTSRIYARLRKRYATPFATPFPEIVCGWLTDIVTPLVYRRKGVDPSDEQLESLDAAAQRAWDEIREAADSNEGLYDLPLRQDVSESALGPPPGGPYSYSEASPYTWTDAQADAITNNGGRVR